MQQHPLAGIWRLARRTDRSNHCDSFGNPSRYPAGDVRFYGAQSEAGWLLIEDEDCVLVTLLAWLHGAIPSPGFRVRRIPRGTAQPPTMVVH